MIGGTRNTLLAASLLIAAPAIAAQPDGGHYVWVPSGATVVMLPAIAAAPGDFPVARMIAQQEASMHRMVTDIDSLMTTAMPDPEQMIRSAMQGMPPVAPVAPVSGVVVTSISPAEEMQPDHHLRLSGRWRATHCEGEQRRQCVRCDRFIGPDRRDADDAGSAAGDPRTGRATA